MQHEPGFIPNLDILPPPQRALWDELGQTPETFALYGGTALALRLGHRISVDFDFFSNDPFDPDTLARSLAYLRDAERLQVDDNTLTCRVDCGGPVLISFFGGLGLGRVAEPEQAQGSAVAVASLLDLAGTKVAVVQKRAQMKDYLDIDALLQHGLTLPTMLAAGRIIYGRSFNPLISLKALTYFGDMPALPAAVRDRVAAAAAQVDPSRLPILAPHTPRPLPGEGTP